MPFIEPATRTQDGDGLAGEMLVGPTTMADLSSFMMVAHRRGPWSQHEDRYLIELVTRNGPHNWVRISQEISTRSPKQCRERYHQNLKPSLNHEPISAEEGELIEKLVAEMGKRWAEIARRLQGRSDNAVKNWWNGGQNRRKRNPERDSPVHSQMHHAQAVYPYSAVVHSTHHDDEAHRLSYSSSPRASFHPQMHSPHVPKLPQPGHFDTCAGVRPPPLQLYPSHTARGRGIETPMPSPSGYSIVSADGAPSLITDTGSESRSPRGAASPLDLTLAPLVGSRGERRSSCARFLPQMGFANEDDDHTAYEYRGRGSVQLPPLVAAETRTSTPLREPVSSHSHSHPRERPQLLTQSAQPLVHHHFLPHSAPLLEQKPLPSFASLADPGHLPMPSPRQTSPSTRHLPAPFGCIAQPHERRSAPTSPKGKMDLRFLV